jgi:hypothetical protein
MTTPKMKFNPKQTAHIRSIKELIEEMVDAMQTQPWAEGYILPWDKMFLTGGAIASLIQGEKPKDLDFYFTDEQHMLAMRAHLLHQKQYIADVDPKYKEVLGENGKMITANAITMNDSASFITMMWGTPAVIKSNFDYVHCTPHYSLVDRMLYISPKQYTSALHKVLVVNNQSAVKEYRTQKFKERGYT